MRISERGQITIPKHLRDRFGLDHNVEIVIRPTDEGLLIQKKRDARDLTDEVACRSDKGEHPVDRVAGALDGADFNIDEYIEEIRGR